MSQPIGKPFQLDPEARQAVGRVAPDGRGYRCGPLVQQAIQEQYEEAEKTRLKANHPVDLPKTPSVGVRFHVMARRSCSAISEFDLCTPVADGKPIEPVNLHIGVTGSQRIKR